MNTYYKVEWPESQDYIEHPRFDECYPALTLDKDLHACNLLFVPEDLYEEITLSKLYPSEIDLPIGHMQITLNQFELDGIKYTRDPDQLKKGSEVILYNPEKGYWITKCITYANGFPPIFEDSSTLIDTEIIGIKND